MKNIERFNIEIDKNSTYIFNELYDNYNIRMKLFQINSICKGEWFQDKDGLLKKKEYMNININNLPDILHNLTDNGNINIKIKNIIINSNNSNKDSNNYIKYKIKTKYTIKNKNKLLNNIINKIVKIKNNLYITKINNERSLIHIKLSIKSLLPFGYIIENYVENMCYKYIEEIEKYFNI
jgi:hypothetical protein